MLGLGGAFFDLETGLYSFGHRFYDMFQGRFISRDPIGTWGDVFNLGNGYAFVGNNATNRMDLIGCKTFAVPHVVDTSGSIVDTQFALDTSLYGIYTDGLTGGPSGGSGTATMSVYLFDGATGLIAESVTGSEVCNPNAKMVLGPFSDCGDSGKRGRNASVTRPQETTWNQKGPSPIYKIEDQQTCGSNTVLSGKFAFVGDGFAPEPQGGSALTNHDHYFAQLGSASTQPSPGSIPVAVDVFNVFNSSVIMNRQRNMDANSFLDPIEIMGPRLSRFNGRVTF